MIRRKFIKTAATASLLAPFASCKSTSADAPKSADVSKKTVIPRWRGFNLVNMFLPIGNTFNGSGNYNLGPFWEEDFEIIKGWGFNFVRLPLCYWCWSAEDDWFRMDEKALKQIDQAVEWGKQYGIHVNINFHRAPGYCVNPDPIIKLKTNLFKDEAPLEAFCYHWGKFAERYKGIPNSQVSFDLLNEPPSAKRVAIMQNEANKNSPDAADIGTKAYEKVIRAAVKAIRDVDSNRLIAADGLDYGKVAVKGLEDIDNFFQSARGYQPGLITHHNAHWINNKNPLPENKLKWPTEFNGVTYDKNFLRATYREGWDAWEKLGGAVHVGEFGCYKNTPAPVAEAWLKDITDVIRERNWGWALWRLRGTFGVIDNERIGATQDNFRGCKLDRGMIEILKNS